MRFGKISYKEEDVKVWDQSWEPSEKVVRHLLQVWMFRPLANVRFVAKANGGVSYIVRPRGFCYGLFLILWAFIISCLKLSRDCLFRMFQYLYGKLSRCFEWFRDLIKRCTCRTRDCLTWMFHYLYKKIFRCFGWLRERINRCWITVRFMSRWT